ncbi:hypothetical protein [Gordonia paraffinivorans]|uniref:hypothetical protein n=1 Tax=Gordonia paraffinivorans TaxID=175628 RepID=UPI003FCD3C3E
MSTPTLAALAIAKHALSIPWSTRVTNDPQRFGRISRSGGSRDRHLDRVNLTIEVYASTPQGAPDTGWAETAALTVADAFQTASNGGPWAGLWVTDWETNSIVDYPHPDYPKHSRWQVYGTLYIRR